VTDNKAHWNEVYEKLAPREVSWYQIEPTLSLELIARTEIPKEAPIIDVGGGASTLVDSLLVHGFSDLAVLDLSGKALAHARRRLGANGARVEWFEQDITEFSAPRRFSLWHDRAVFHFLTETGQRELYMEALRRAIAPGGHVIIAAFAIGGPTRCSGLDIVQYDARKIKVELGPEFRLVEELSELHITPAAQGQKFGFFRFVRV
jgi:SAM-dependent methyltransferase